MGLYAKNLLRQKSGGSSPTPATNYKEYFYRPSVAKDRLKYQANRCSLIAVSTVFSMTTKIVSVKEKKIHIRSSFLFHLSNKYSHFEDGH